MLNFAVGVICRFVFLIQFCACVGKISLQFAKDMVLYLFDDGRLQKDDQPQGRVTVFIPAPSSSSREGAHLAPLH
jgi:hypothetical protein